MRAARRWPSQLAQRGTPRCGPLGSASSSKQASRAPERRRSLVVPSGCLVSVGGDARNQGGSSSAGHTHRGGLRLSIRVSPPRFVELLSLVTWARDQLGGAPSCCLTLAGSEFVVLAARRRGRGDLTGEPDEAVPPLKHAAALAPRHERWIVAAIESGPRSSPRSCGRSAGPIANDPTRSGRRARSAIASFVPGLRTSPSG